MTDFKIVKSTIENPIQKSIKDPKNIVNIDDVSYTSKLFSYLNPFSSVSKNFDIVPPFPYSYHTDTLNYGLTGPFSPITGTIYATRINRSVTLTFNGISITGNNNSSVINFPSLPSEYVPLNTSTSSFPVDIIQAGVTCPGRAYITGNNLTIGSGITCSPFTGSTNLQGYLGFNITYID